MRASGNVPGLSGSQRALLQVDLDTELLAEPKDKVPRPNQIPEQGPEDSPVVEVPQDPEPVTMHNRLNQGHDESERLRSCRKAEAKSAKLKDLLPYTESQVTTRVRMNRSLKVSVLQVQRHHPIPRTQRLEDRLLSLHVKMGDSNRPVETGEVYHRPPTPGDLGGNKQSAVVAWRKRSKFYCPFRAKIRHRSAQSQSPDGRWGVAGKGNGHIGKRGSYQEGNEVAKPQGLHNSAVGIPRLLHPPMWAQTTPNHGRRT